MPPRVQPADRSDHALGLPAPPTVVSQAADDHPSVLGEESKRPTSGLASTGETPPSGSGRSGAVQDLHPDAALRHHPSRCRYRRHAQGGRVPGQVTQAGGPDRLKTLLRQDEVVGRGPLAGNAQQPRGRVRAPAVHVCVEEVGLRRDGVSAG